MLLFVLVLFHEIRLVRSKHL